MQLSKGTATQIPVTLEHSRRVDPEYERTVRLVRFIPFAPSREEETASLSLVAGRTTCILALRGHGGLHAAGTNGICQFWTASRAPESFS